MKTPSWYYILICVLLLTSCLACEGRQSARKTINLSTQGQILGHKGSGTFGEFGNLFRDNSVAGILNAIEKFDGAEFDIQMSADSTLWIFHDHEIMLCDASLRNISLLEDREIEQLSVCQYHASLARLIDLIPFLKRFETKKTLSLDLKVLQNTEAIQRLGGEKELGQYVIRKLETFFANIEGYDVLIEVPTVTLYELFTENGNNAVYVLYNSEDFELLLEQQIPVSIGVHQIHPGVRTALNKSNIDRQFWVVNSANEFMKIKDLNRQYLQTDNLQFFENLRANNWEVPMIEVDYLDVAAESEFVELFSSKQAENPEMIHLKNLPQEDALMVTSVTDAEGNVILWRGDKLMDLYGDYFFYSHEFSTQQKEVLIKLFIWRIQQTQ